ncbi:BamA/TamA family outer membrane protein [Labilibacter marinus]|uniref:BamA/TamA family outer membrane protein n=1 Tax=Labilibacter marinus TaxID=1477105 RepID=UPI00082E747F|nr:BamA/TamA family outer membrane protein [Labilibacter marinus]
MRSAFIIVLICIFSVVAAQDTTVVKKERKISFIPLPVIASTPATGFMYGVAPSASWYMGDKSNTRISSALGTIIYTTKKQLILTLKSNTYLSSDSWILLTDIRYFITSQPTYGLGTGPANLLPMQHGLQYTQGSTSPLVTGEQMMEFNYFRFHETVLKRVNNSSFYAGIGLHYDYHFKIKDNLLNPPDSITSHYAYSKILGFNPEKYTTSGLSFNGMYDSRDNAINPYSGRYAFVNFRYNPEFMGSSKNSSILWYEYRDYLNVNKDRPRHLIGFWTYGWFVSSGDVPYLDLPGVGWDQFGRSGRAYAQGRFRGEDMLYGEVEYRMPLQKNKDTFGAVLFVNSTSASNRLGGVNIADSFDFGVGAGLRIMVDKSSRANLAIDFAVGEHGESGFYLGINEVF